MTAWMTPVLVRCESLRAADAPRGSGIAIAGTAADADLRLL
jgi:hypothetical protein